MRLAAGAFALALALPSPAGGWTATPAPGGRCGLNEYYLDTFHVEVKLDKKEYRVGETVKVHTTVTRPAEKDPLGLGIPLKPPHSEPAEEVTIGAGASIGDVYLAGGAPLTNAEGKTTAKIKLESYTRPGPAALRVYASKKYLKGQAADCVVIVEQGSYHDDHAFDVVE